MTVKMKPFGIVVEPWMGSDEYWGDKEPGEHCRCCGRYIAPGEDCYDINEQYYCRLCGDAADEAILEIERPNYMCTMEV